MPPQLPAFATGSRLLKYMESPTAPSAVKVPFIVIFDVFVINLTTVPGSIVRVAAASIVKL